MSDNLFKMEKPLPYGNSRKRFHATTIGVAVGGIILSAAVFAAIRSDEMDQARWEFERSSRDHIAALWKTLESDFLVFRSVQAFYTADENVSHNEFNGFTAPLIENQPSIRAVHWAPCVRGPKDEEKFPIEWSEPRGGNAASVGFDLATNPSCLKAIRRSCDTRLAAMTSKMVLPYEIGTQPGVRVFLPVYKKNSTLNTAEDRRENLQGVIVGILRLKGIAEESLAALTPVGLDISLIDDSADSSDRVLYFYSSRTRLIDVDASDDTVVTPDKNALSVIVNKEVAGRQWTVVCTPSPQFLADQTTFIPWAGAAGLLLLTGLLTAYLSRRRRTAALLAENDRKLHGILDQTFQLMGLLTPDGRLVEVNKAALDFVGLRKANVLNRYFWDTPWWNHSPKLQEELRRAVKKAADGYSVRFEASHLLSDGSLRWIDVSLKPIKDDNNNVIYIIPEGYDVTEHKLAVQRQERSIERLEQINRLQEELLSPATLEEKFKKITDAAVHIFDLDFCRIWMIHPGDLCEYGCKHAKSADGLRVCADRDRCLHMMASSGRYTHIDGGYGRAPIDCCMIGRIAGGADKKFLTNRVATDPRVHDREWAKELGLVSFAGYKLHDIDGNPVGVLAMFAKRPISEEKDAFLSGLAEIASKTIIDSRAAEALRTSERRYRLFAENVADVIWTMDLAGNFSYMSPSVEKLLGFKWEEGMELSIADIMSPASLAVSQRTLKNLHSEALKGRRAEFRIELELPLKNGSTVWTEVTVSGLYDESNRIVGALGTTRNITARRAMEQELRQAKEAAETATREKSQFLARMSHEIRNPMTSIMGYTDLLMDRNLNQSSRNNYLAVIRRNGEHLLSLINDILDLSKIESGKFTLEMQRCNPASLLADVAGTIRPRAELRGIALSLEYETELPETILTDSARLRQALINLVGNAVKFTHQGGVRIVASLLPEWQGKPAVRVQVIDTGIGIREDVLPKLFEPFSQGDEAVFRKFGGTGLGLAISRHISNMLGGELAASSVFGKGSNFNLTVPVGDLEGIPMLKNPVEAEREQPLLPEDQPSKDLAGLRVLLAEDGYDNRQLIQAFLLAAGATVETVENGREAVEKAEAEAFDTILMDMNMPVMDGYEATRRLREHGYDRPILALTANAMVSDAAQCLAAGCNQHLTKPIDRARLVRAIAACTGRIAAETELLSAPPQSIISAGGPIVSFYANDPDVADILEGFIEGLADQLTQMGRAFAENRYDDLKRFAHRLKGAGGSYGYPMLTDASKKLEDAAAAQDHQAVDLALDEVAGLCRAIKDGYRSTIISAGRKSP